MHQATMSISVSSYIKFEVSYEYTPDNNLRYWLIQQFNSSSIEPLTTKIVDCYNIYEHIATHIYTNIINYIHRDIYPTLYLDVSIFKNRNLAYTSNINMYIVDESYPNQDDLNVENRLKTICEIYILIAKLEQSQYHQLPNLSNAQATLLLSK